MVVNIKTKSKVSCLKTLETGHLYKDDKGNEIIFIGFGKLQRFENDCVELCWETNEVFLYIKKPILMKALDKKILTMAMDKFDENNLAKSDFFSIINFSSKPRHLVEDLGEFFQPEMFRNRVIEDYYCFHDYHSTYSWKIETREIY